MSYLANTNSAVRNRIQLTRQLLSTAGSQFCERCLSLAKNNNNKLKKKKLEKCLVLVSKMTENAGKSQRHRYRAKYLSASLASVPIVQAGMCIGA